MIAHQMLDRIGVDVRISGARVSAQESATSFTTWESLTRRRR